MVCSINSAVRVLRNVAAISGMEESQRYSYYRVLDSHLPYTHKMDMQSELRMNLMGSPGTTVRRVRSRGMKPDCGGANGRLSGTIFSRTRASSDSLESSFNCVWILNSAVEKLPA